MNDSRSPPDDTRPIVITLHVDAALAVKAGHGRAGMQKLELRAPELALLTEQQRDTLARHIAGEESWSRPLNRRAPKIGTADLAALCMLLDARAASFAPEGFRVYHKNDSSNPAAHRSRSGPWYFEPIGYDNAAPYSVGYGSQTTALDAAHYWKDER